MRPSAFQAWVGPSEPTCSADKYARRACAASTHNRNADTLRAVVVVFSCRAPYVYVNVKSRQCPSVIKEQGTEALFWTVSRELSIQ